MNNNVNLKDLHEKYITDVAGEVIMDSEYEDKLWNFNQGDKIDLNSRVYNGSQTLLEHDLKITILRGPVKEHWAYTPFKTNELNLMFYATDYPEVVHFWRLFEEDR